MYWPAPNPNTKKEKRTDLNNAAAVILQPRKSLKKILNCRSTCSCSEKRQKEEYIGRSIMEIVFFGGIIGQIKEL